MLPPASSQRPEPPVADHRLADLRAWLEICPHAAGMGLEPASADASFRRYFRLSGADRPTLIAMDAPPPQEDCQPFVHAARVFAECGVRVPQVLAEDLERGFLLLSDLGLRTYLDVLTPANADGYYRAANAELVKLQQGSRPGVFPEYDAALLEREVRLFPDWYLTRHLEYTPDAAEIESLESVYRLVVARTVAQPAVFVHRDWHSRNLMASDPAPGVLDFQDAVYGPVTYDLVSLLRDAYIVWPEAEQLDWAIRYWELARKAALPVPADFSDFWRDFEWMGVQRHLKVLGIFARLWHRDGKDGYLKDMPAVFNYLHLAARRYKELKPLAKLMDRLAGDGVQTGLTF
jgi:aminoglycoside/choline kinase family phosphotransferase